MKYPQTEAGFRHLQWRPLMCVLCWCLLLMSGCARRTPPPEIATCPPGETASKPGTFRPYEIDGVWYYPLPSARNYSEEGLASWYGRKFHGRKTANGECYNMHDMTAAHKTLPMGTEVKVTSLRNGRSIRVRINDRGPFVRGRIIDLSYEAAKKLGITKSGVARVRVETVKLSALESPGPVTIAAGKPSPDFAEGSFTIQIGSFQDLAHANELREMMESQYEHVRVNSFQYHGVFYYRVQVGRFEDLTKARREMGRLKESGFPDAFVVALEKS